MMYLLYFANVKPYTDQEANQWEMFNEVCVISVTYTLMFLSQYHDDIEIRYTIGWGYVAIIAFNLFCNCYKIFQNMVNVSIPTSYR
jgi:hypothetical protein